MTGHGTADIILTAIGDTSVSGTEVTHAPRGLAESVHLSNNRVNGVNRHKGYFLFDLSDQMALPGFADTEATFTVHFLGGSGAGSGQGIALLGLNAGFSGTTSWDESTLISTDAPANASTNSFVAGQTTEIDSFGFVLYTFTGPRTLTVPRIGDYLQADGTATFMLIGTTDDADRNLFVGASNNPDSSLHPSLIVIPEPSTLLLVGVAGIAGVLALRRRRR